MKNVLFITKDSDLFNELSHEAGDKDISLIRSYSTDEADKALTSQPIDVVILEEDQVETVKNWTATQKKNKDQLKFFVLVQASYDALLKEKENLPIHGLLQKPLSKEMQILLLYLIYPKKELPDSDLKELILEYQKAIFDKLYFVQALKEKFLQSKGGDDRVSLRNAVHKLAGNSGSYGYLETSKLCKTEEKILESTDEVTKEDLDAFFQNLIKSFFAPTEVEAAVKSPEGQPPQAAGDQISLYLIDDDQDLTKLIQAAAQSKDIKVECENSFAKALEKILQPGFAPRVILFDLVSDKEPLTGYDLIEKFLASPTKNIDTILGILSAKGEVSSRLKTLNFAIDFFIQKPVNPDELLETITKLSKKQAEKTYKVLLVDDDDSFCKLMQAGFQNSKIELKTLNSGESLLPELEIFRPDLLLLDYFLPNQSGLELFRILRSDIKYRSMPIMFITANEDPSLYKEAIALSIQGFFTKPITPESLLESLKNFFFKKQSVQTVLQKDPTLGIYQKDYIVEMFGSSVKLNETFCLVFIKQNFDPNKISNIDATTFWGQFCSKLNTITSDKDLIGNWDTFTLIVMIFDFKKEQLRNLFEFFYTDIFSQELKDKGEFKIQTAIYTYPKDGKSLDELSTKAIEIFKTPSEKLWDISAETTTELDVERATKNVFLICSDKMLMDILEYTLSLRNIMVFKAENGLVAIEWFQKNSLKQPLDLIIIDYDLTGENGFVVLQKVSNFVGERVPILLLSSLSKESDILIGIEEGVRGLVTKPFNMHLLLAKIEQMFH